MCGGLPAEVSPLGCWIGRGPSDWKNVSWRKVPALVTKAISDPCRLGSLNDMGNASVPLASPIGTLHVTAPCGRATNCCMVTAPGAAIPAHCGGLTGGGGGGGGAAALNVPQTVTSELTVRVQPALPLQPPPHPVKDEPESACWFSAIAEPMVTVKLHALGQSIPDGLEVTRPEPLPIK